MASQASSILSWVASQLATINGAGEYQNDVSAAGKIVVGSDVPTPNQVQMDPMLFVGDVTVDSVRGPNLNSFQKELQVMVWGFKATSTDTALARTSAALDLAADVETALCGTSARRSGGGLFHDAYAATIARDGNSAGYQGRGVCAVAVTFVYRGIV